MYGELSVKKNYKINLWWVIVSSRSLDREGASLYWYVKLENHN